MFWFLNLLYHHSFEVRIRIQSSLDAENSRYVIVEADSDSQELFLIYSLYQKSMKVFI
jgi:hypothetical protein